LGEVNFGVRDGPILIGYTITPAQPSEQSLFFKKELENPGTLKIHLPIDYKSRWQCAEPEVPVTFELVKPPHTQGKYYYTDPPRVALTDDSGKTIGVFYETRQTDEGDNKFSAKICLLDAATTAANIQLSYAPFEFVVESHGFVSKIANASIQANNHYVFDTYTPLPSTKLPTILAPPGGQVSVYINVIRQNGMSGITVRADSTRVPLISEPLAPGDFHVLLFSNVIDDPERTLQSYIGPSIRIVYMDHRYPLTLSPPNKFQVADASFINLFALDIDGKTLRWDYQLRKPFDAIYLYGKLDHLDFLAELPDQDTSFKKPDLPTELKSTGPEVFSSESISLVKDLPLPADWPHDQSRRYWYNQSTVTFTPTPGFPAVFNQASTGYESAKPLNAPSGLMDFASLPPLHTAITEQFGVNPNHLVIRLVNVQGKPLSDVLVWGYDAERNIIARQRTDAQGLADLGMQSQVRGIGYGYKQAVRLIDTGLSKGFLQYVVKNAPHPCDQLIKMNVSLNVFGQKLSEMSVRQPPDPGINTLGFVLDPITGLYTQLVSVCADQGVGARKVYAYGTSAATSASWLPTPNMAGATLQLQLKPPTQVEVKAEAASASNSFESREDLALSFTQAIGNPWAGVTSMLSSSEYAQWKISQSWRSDSETLLKHRCSRTGFIKAAPGKTTPLVVPPFSPPLLQANSVVFDTINRNLRWIKPQDDNDWTSLDIDWQTDEQQILASIDARYIRRDENGQQFVLMPPIPAELDMTPRSRIKMSASLRRQAHWPLAYSTQAEDLLWLTGLEAQADWLSQIPIAEECQF
jgi:hypothetical protein